MFAVAVAYMGDTSGSLLVWTYRGRPVVVVLAVDAVWCDAVVVRTV